MSYTPIQLAEAFIQAGELEDALHALNEHLSTHPGDDDARRLRVQVLLRQYTPAAAQRGLADLDALGQPTAPDIYTRSVLWEALADLPQALTAARQALAQATDDGFRDRALGRVLILLQKTGEHQAALELALQRDWVQWVADAAITLQDTTTAIEYYTRALDRVEALKQVTADDIAANIRARVLLKRARAYQRTQQWDAADADYQAAATVIPNDPMLPFNRALIAFQRGDLNTAKTLFQQAYGAAPPALRKLMDNNIQSRPSLAALWQQVTESTS